MGWFKWFKKKVPYVPQGRIGYFYRNDFGYHYTIIVEEIGRIGERSKVKILDVDIHRGNSKTRAQCLREYGRGDWIVRSQFVWETPQQRALRLGGVEPEQAFVVENEPMDVDFRTEELRNPPAVFDIND